MLLGKKIRLPRSFAGYLYIYIYIYIYKGFGWTARAPTRFSRSTLNLRGLRSHLPPGHSVWPCGTAFYLNWHCPGYSAVALSVLCLSLGHSSTTIFTAVVPATLNRLGGLAITSSHEVNFVYLNGHKGVLAISWALSSSTFSFSWRLSSLGNL